MTDAPPRADRAALAALLFGATLIGCGPIMIRLAGAGPSAIGFWRLAFALPFLSVIALVERRRFPTDTPLLAAPRAAWFAGAMFAADLAFWHYGVHYTSVANATVLSNLTPVLVAVAAWLLFKERPTLRLAAGLVLAVGGAVLMAAARRGTLPPGANPVLGDLLSVSTAFWYSAYFLAVRRARESLGTGKLMLVSSLAGLPILLVAALLLGERLFPTTPVGWAACAGLGLMHVGGQGSIAWALGRLPTALASVVVLIQPVVAAGLGWIVFGEPVAPLQGLGAAIALGGVVLAQTSARRPAPVPLTEG
jgi:drug/metabolite transporter (DMT)-like permease